MARSPIWQTEPSSAESCQGQSVTDHPGAFRRKHLGAICRENSTGARCRSARATGAPYRMPPLAAVQGIGFAAVSCGDLRSVLGLFIAFECRTSVRTQARHMRRLEESTWSLLLAGRATNRIGMGGHGPKSGDWAAAFADVIIDWHGNSDRTTERVWWPAATQLLERGDWPYCDFET